MKSYTDYQRHNMFRRPDWRFERVLQMIDRYPTPGRCTRRDDDFVRKARNFILRWRGRTIEERAELFWEEPDLYYAYEIYERTVDEPRAPYLLQARLLAGQSPEVIARTEALPAGTVLWYEALFFNVVDRLHQRDWITRQVLLPAFSRNAGLALPDDGIGLDRVPQICLSFLDESLKMFAYFGGPHVVDVFAHGFRPGTVLATDDEMPAWIDQNWSTTVRRRSAQAALQFQVNRYNVMELFQTHARIVEIEKSADTDMAQRTSYERNVKAMLDSLPLYSGKRAIEQFKGTALGKFDNEPAELRDDEVHLVATGLELRPIKDEFPKALPPPRQRRKAEPEGERA